MGKIWRVVPSLRLGIHSWRERLSQRLVLCSSSKVQVQLHCFMYNESRGETTKVSIINESNRSNWLKASHSAYINQVIQKFKILWYMLIFWKNRIIWFSVNPIHVKYTSDLLWPTLMSIKFEYILMFLFVKVPILELPISLLVIITKVW